MSGMSPQEKKEFYLRFDNVEMSIQRILGILESDDKIKEKGLVEKVNLMNTQLNELLTREEIYKAKATSWGIIGGAVGTVLIWLLKFLYSKLIVIA